MERIKELNSYQKAVLMISVLMLLVFTVLYPVTSARVGFEYQGKILVPHEQNGITVYEGRIKGQNSTITVTSDKTVTMHYGEKVYGPYTARKDPSAVPAVHDLAEYMTGVELLEGEEVFFRGGVFSTGSGLALFNEDGSGGSYLTFTGSDATVYDEEGNIIDTIAPSATTILELMRGPELTSKGEGYAWVMGAVLVVLTVVTILYADELFYFAMSFRVQDPYGAEPSDWEIAGRYISWTVLPFMALVVFIMGLVT